MRDRECSSAATTPTSRSSPGRRGKPHPEHELTAKNVLQPYCNRASTHWYAMDKATPQNHPKPPKQAKFPDALGRLRTCASKLVPGAGQRFESARRLFVFPAKPAKTKGLRSSSRRLCQQYVSSRLSESLVPCICVLRAFAGHTAGGVGACSAVDSLTDVPEFRLVRHRRKSFTRVPRVDLLCTSVNTSRSGRCAGDYSQQEEPRVVAMRGFIERFADRMDSL